MNSGGSLPAFARRPGQVTCDGELQWTNGGKVMAKGKHRFFGRRFDGGGFACACGKTRNTLRSIQRHVKRQK